jgi:hypothetical protein
MLNLGEAGAARLRPLRISHAFANAPVTAHPMLVMTRRHQSELVGLGLLSVTT